MLPYLMNVEVYTTPVVHGIDYLFPRFQEVVPDILERNFGGRYCRTQEPPMKRKDPAAFLEPHSQTVGCVHHLQPSINKSDESHTHFPCLGPIGLKPLPERFAAYNATILGTREEFFPNSITSAVLGRCDWTLDPLLGSHDSVGISCFNTYIEQPRRNLHIHLSLISLCSIYSFLTLCSCDLDIPLQKVGFHFSRLQLAIRVSLDYDDGASLVGKEKSYKGTIF